MTDFQFSLLRYASVPVALVLVCDWLLLPSHLQTNTSIQQQVSAKYEKRKYYEFAVLQNQNWYEWRIHCENASKLCTRLQRAPLTDLQVWLHEPGLIHGPWVVAAKVEDTQLSSPEDIRSTYFQFKAMWAAVTLVLVALVFVLWRCGPFDSKQENPP